MSNVLSLVSGRQGHFRLESGHHTDLWLDLDSVFVNSQRISPLVRGLAARIRPHEVAAICGPLLGGAFLAQLVAQELNVDFVFTERNLITDSEMSRASYTLPSALVSAVRYRRVAIVDDVMSAGSALGGTLTDLRRRGGRTVVVGAFMVLGTVGASFFNREGVPVEALDRCQFNHWLPADCPRCANGEAIEDLAV